MHKKKTLVNPRTNAVLDLEVFSHPALYSTLASLEEDEIEANEAADTAAELEATAEPAVETTATETTTADGEQASIETQAALEADKQAALVADTQAALVVEAAPAGAPVQDSLGAALHAALAARDAA